MTTPLTAARRAASFLGRSVLCASVLLVGGTEGLVEDAKASLAITNACVSGVDIDGRPVLNLDRVTMCIDQHGGMAHP